MVSSTPTIEQIFHGFDLNNENHIHIVVIIRKILHDLNQLRPYHNHMPTLVSFINAICSKNINMIAEETQRFEEIYIHDGQVFPIHPLQLINTLLEKGDVSVGNLRTFMYQLYDHTKGDNVTCVNVMNSWLLTVNLHMYRLISNQVYTN